MHTPVEYRAPAPSSPAEHEERFTLAHFFHTLHRYRAAILLSIMGVFIAYILLVVATLLIAPARRITSMQFRLQFDSAAEQYPNGTRFSTADITATPVLFAVWDANKLGDYISFGEFSRSVFILETNREFEELNREYGAKLADPKLSPVDRERLEREYNDKLRGIGKFDYSINFVAPNRVRGIPRPIIRKVLGDILSQWATQAANEKKVLQYAVPVLSSNILRSPSSEEGFLRRILLLRQRVTALMANVDEIARIPGADVMRTSKERISLAEVRLELNDIARYDIDPLISAARAAGLTGSQQSAVEMLQSQLEYDSRSLAAARAKETALRNSFVMYQAEFQSGDGRPEEAGAPLDQSERKEDQNVTTVVSDSFLDRVVNLANNAADREYRQQLTDEIKSAALAVPVAEAAVQYDTALLESFRRGTTGGPADPAAVQRRWDEVTRRVANVVQQINEIYTITSRQLNAQSALFTVTSSTSSRIERPISLERLGLLGILLMLLSVPVIIGACLLHNRVREEEAAESHLNTGEAA